MSSIYYLTHTHPGPHHLDSLHTPNPFQLAPLPAHQHHTYTQHEIEGQKKIEKKKENATPHPRPPPRPPAHPPNPTSNLLRPCPPPLPKPPLSPPPTHPNTNPDLQKPTNTTTTPTDAQPGTCNPSPGDPNLTWICADVEGTPCDPYAWEDKLAGRRLARCGDDVREVD
ncbi:hypothetical protein Tdes44962_MAKER08659 [Teratosphaeria destructans]|uniref:Uncharacterized protein n=1 Tax=Teratosphaeria destructans TaxID=418781 RepID=A0A9W7SVU6_9PEZI|nr:hypothetical protein Tdes44962_MAKER08659 [Teratosphaeria destructans]